MKYIPNLALIAGLALAIGFGTTAAAAPITVGDPNGYLIVSQRANNSLGFAPGERITYGDTSVVPNGTGGTTGTASTVNLSTGQTVTHTLPFTGSPAIPNQFSNSIPYDSNQTGAWTLTFQNGSNSVTVTTPSITGVAPPPYASNVTYSGTAANPAFTWNYPANSVNGVFFDIYDSSVVNPAGGASLVYSKVLAGTTNSWTVPTTLAGGLTLQQGHQYTLDLYGVVSRNPANALSNANSQGWSQAYFNFTPQPNGSPNVSLPLLTTTGAYQYSLAVVAGQTYFIDPLVATGYHYVIGTGDPNFESVLLPAIQSTPFTISFDENGTIISNLIAGGTVFDFPTGGVSAFDVTDIAPTDGLDPANTEAFVTGLTFTGNGTFDGTQTPITTFIPAVPEPPGAAMFALGLSGVFALRRKRWKS